VHSPREKPTKDRQEKELETHEISQECAFEGLVKNFTPRPPVSKFRNFALQKLFLVHSTHNSGVSATKIRIVE